MAEFEEAIPITLENEGGYVWSKDDPGGETKFGISKRSYPNVDIQSLTVEQATAIYLRDFWRFSGVNSQPLANKIFDMYVPAKHNAIKVLQGLLSADEDGIYGPATEKLVNLAEPAQLLANFRIGMVQYYIEVAEKHPEEAGDLKGWLKRARQ